MYDYSNNRSIPDYWVNRIRTNCGNIPMVICATKCDIRNRNPLTVEGAILMSSRSNYNFEKPFLQLARSLANDPNLEFGDQDPVNDIPIYQP